MLRRSRRGRSVSAPPTAAPTCAHLSVEVAEPQPLTPGRCQECTELGENTWAHLRMCMACGHIGCCDSSPHQHASKHFQLSGHPVMRSAEPGESWRWCYIDHRIG